VYYGVFAGFLFGTIVALPLLVTGRASARTAIALGPMLLLGALVVLAFDIAPGLLGVT
jgi:leader peptidase (prepilin peptidase)/N-methyltransferase